MLVADLDRFGGRVPPACAGLSPFEEREPVGIEKTAAVGRQAHGLVLDATVNSAERGQQSAPCIESGLLSRCWG